MAHDRMTAADVLAVNNSEEIIGCIVQTALLYPELAVFPASPVAKTKYSTLVRTALPSVGFRSINTGRDNSRATLTERTVEAMFLDASWDIDEAAARKAEWGVEAACGIQRQAHIDAAFGAIAAQIWQGTDASASGFAGLNSLLNGLNDTMMVNAGGSGAACTSIWGIQFNPRVVRAEGAERQVAEVMLCFGLDARLAVGDTVYDTLPTSDGTTMWGWKQAISGYVGLQACNYDAFGRIANLDSTHAASDDLIASLLSKFRVGRKPDYLFMNRTSMKALQDSRTATNSTGAPAPFPTEAFGVPIIVTDSIPDTEAAITATT